MAGLVPAISLRFARQYAPCRDCRDKPGNDTNVKLPALRLRRAVRHDGVTENRLVEQRQCQFLHLGAALIESSRPNQFDGQYGIFGLAETLYRPFFDLAPRKDPWPNRKELRRLAMIPVPSKSVSSGAMLKTQLTSVQKKKMAKERAMVSTK